MPAPVDAVTMPDPYPYYARLVEQQPCYFDEPLGCWVASSAAAVTAVLGDPAFRVRPADQPVPPGIAGTAAGEVFGRLVRMTDGPRQQQLTRLVGGVLAAVEPGTVADLAAAQSRRVLSRRPHDLSDALLFGVPARVVAALCGLDDGSADDAARLTAEFVRCLPASATADENSAAARAAAELRRLMSPCLSARAPGLLGDLARATQAAGWRDPQPPLANGIGLLSQTYDATAGLIGNTLLAIRREGTPDNARLEPFVRETARHDAPVHSTRRFAARPARVGEVTVGSGQSVLVLLAAANRDPAANPDPARFRPDRRGARLFTFGAAAHRCPGETLAVTIAAAVVAEVLAAGFDPAQLPAQVRYRSSANLRVPVLPTLVRSTHG